MLTAYAALTLTACAGIAVLGARRPGVIAWNFIVASLLIVLWLGWAEGLLAGTELKLGNVRFAFLCVLLAITIVNYVPTRFSFAAISLGIGCALTLRDLFGNQFDNTALALVGVAMAPWLALLDRATRGRHGAESDEVWKRFRDRYGAVWAERLREQFNHAARHAGWPVELRWNGLRSKTGDIRPEWIETLTSLQKRFRSDG
jgi:hypothetical protein